MKILFAGTPESAAIVLRNLVQSGHEVVAVLTRNDALVGRSKTLQQSAVAKAAESLGIRIIKANGINNMILDQIKQTGAEIGLVVAYGTILREDALNCLERGWYNLHYSLLPNYRGAAPIQRALINGDRETGITLFKLDQGMDTGPILANLRVLIQPDETAGELMSRMSELGSTLLNEALPSLYARQEKLVPQKGDVTLAPKITREDARIDFTLSAASIENLVRGMNPEPMAWCLLNDETFRILQARQLNIDVSNLKPGSLIRGPKPAVVCGNATALELIAVQPSSKKAMAGADWMRGTNVLGTLR